MRCIWALLATSLIGIAACSDYPTVSATSTRVAETHPADVTTEAAPPTISDPPTTNRESGSSQAMETSTGFDSDSCTYNGVPLYGRVQVVDVFANFDVQVVDFFPDLKVQVVDLFPNGCGKWEEVDEFPNFTVRFVDSFPDFKIQFVDLFPGA